MDVWEFDSQAGDLRNVRRWGATQPKLQVFRVDLLATNQIVLRYIEDKKQSAVTPDWTRLGYGNARLLSSDAFAMQDADWPRSMLGWSCLFASSLASVVALRRRYSEPGAQTRHGTGQRGRRGDSSRSCCWQRSRSAPSPRTYSDGIGSH